VTGMLSGPGGAAVMRAADAETMASDAVRVRMLLDSSATNGAASTVQVGLRAGADGAVPHRHDQSSEMFYVLDGQVEVLAGDQVLQASAGDLVVVPPGVPHAFGAPKGSGGELLIAGCPQARVAANDRRTLRFLAWPA
jgi:quercetin dioxygenase-like cupin family protein